MSEKKRVLVAMSGGVDSSVAAALLLDAGYEVEGATMQLWPDPDCEEERVTRGCCSLSAVDDARAVAYALGIKYHVLNFKDYFNRNVIEPFAKEYEQGRTPNPCILCNATVKFQEFLRRATALGFDYIATGHYGIISQENGRYQLRRSATAAKDQTYALYNLTQEQMAHLLLPVGHMEKPMVREYAKKRNIPVFDKPDSQEICFVKDNDYAGFIERRGVESSPGRFVSPDGQVLGKHNGIYHYTVGQRKGLGGGFPQPMFVININKETNDVTIGTNEQTFSGILYADRLNWISFDSVPDGGFSCDAKIRYNGPAAKANVYPDGSGVRVEFPVPVRAITPGQSVVFYDGDRVLGGGIIR